MGKGKKGPADLADGAVTELAGIPSVSDGSIEKAVKNLITAAKNARNQELKEEYGDDSGLVHSSGDAIPEGSKSGDVRSEYAATEADYAWIKEHFTRFYDRPLGTATGMAEQLKLVKDKLDSGKTTVFEDASDAMEGWSGDAARHFNEYFLNPFPNAVDNQNAVIDELRAGLYTFEGIQRRSRETAREIATATTNALDALSGCSATSPEAQFAFTIIGVVLSVAGTLAAPPLGFVGGLALVGSGVTLVGGTAGYVGAKQQEGKEAKEQQHAIAGNKVHEILESMAKQLVNLQDYMYEEELLLSQAFGASEDHVNQSLNSSSSKGKATLLPNEPADSTTNVTSGEKPARDEFRPKALPR